MCTNPSRTLSQGVCDPGFLKTCVCFKHLGPGSLNTFTSICDRRSAKQSDTPLTAFSASFAYVLDWFRSTQGPEYMWTHVDPPKDPMVANSCIASVGAYLVPQTASSCRGSGGVDKGPVVVSPDPSRSVAGHYCCYLSQTVRVTFATPRPFAR